MELCISETRLPFSSAWFCLGTHFNIVFGLLQTLINNDPKITNGDTYG